MGAEDGLPRGLEGVLGPVPPGLEGVGLLAFPVGQGEARLQGPFPVQAVAVGEVQASCGEGVGPLEEEGVKEGLWVVVAEACP